MTEQQFKILCRAYWPNCDFIETRNGFLVCYPANIGRMVWYGEKDAVAGWKGEDANVLVQGEPEEVVKEVYNDTTMGV